MATKAPAPGKRKAKAARGGPRVDNKLESNQRMVWIEQGGIDLRAALAKRQRSRKP